MASAKTAPVKRWNLESLEFALRKALLERARVRVGELSPDRSADAVYVRGGAARIRVDDHKVGVLPGVLHELLHVVLDEEFERFETEIEEILVEALELALSTKVAQSARRVAWWRKAIAERAR